MAECPACFGEGHHDLRAEDAWFAEHHSDEELERMRGLGLTHPAGIVSCDECEGTGVVTEERRKDLWAAAVAHVDQAIAKVLAEERQHEAR